jgi:hypothetical protein
MPPSTMRKKASSSEADDGAEDEAEGSVKDAHALRMLAGGEALTPSSS